jgi:hypothetical protein
VIFNAGLSETIDGCGVDRHTAKTHDGFFIGSITDGRSCFDVPMMAVPDPKNVPFSDTMFRVLMEALYVCHQLRQTVRMMLAVSNPTQRFVMATSASVQKTRCDLTDAVDTCMKRDFTRGQASPE